ncbi:MAG: hypothetical protein C7B47_09160 [Sulfobacillus thermosulfidooxidans]|uniref:Helix-turn-helix domain-containing protein n=1 Tax=Sulfobacillus thermosulfidooxidans TaxID=28034 RepID=A0A2T2WXV3_SULTH|nr:MAG: hypothetical protein C7B47_09160 [Sulfobacillus thermosulfidooxidans]
MFGHYLRVQEVAMLLGVSPATVRWYANQYHLPSYRIGQGQIHHRRFKYDDVQRLALKLGKALPPEPQWDSTLPFSLQDAALYLGLSVKFLMTGGYVKAGEQITRERLEHLEAAIYHLDTDHPDQNGDGALGNIAKEEEIPMMMNKMGCQHRGNHGMHAMGGAMGRRPGMMSNPFYDPEDLLSLKSMKRHLEAQKADIEDRIAEIEKLIASHPDNEQPQ